MNIFGKDGLLGKHWENYEERPGQIKMAEMLTHAIHSSENRDMMGFYEINKVIAEGPVGVGKSLAYIFSALLTPDGKKSDNTVVISTSSIALQHQLMEKDLPTVASILKSQLGIDITFASLKGINNYVCMREVAKLKGDDMGDLLGGSGRSRLVEEIGEELAHHIETTLDGEQPDQVNMESWGKVTTDSSDCDGRQCDFFKGCFYQEAKKDVAKADVIVINHALLSADNYIKLNGGTGILPPHEVLVIDECHELEASATSFLTKRVSPFVIRRLASGLNKMIEKVATKEVMDPETRAFADECFDKWVQISSAIDYQGLEDRVREIAAENPSDLYTRGYDMEHWINQFDRLADAISRFQVPLPDEHGDPSDDYYMPSATGRYLETLTDFVVRLRAIQECRSDMAIFTEGARTNYPAIALTPINVSTFFGHMWGNPERICILASATASVSGDFNYLKKRLGMVDPVIEGMFESPFDYNKQASLIVPQNFNPRDADFDQKVLHAIERTVQNGYNRTLVLFTSYRQMNDLMVDIRNKFRDHLVIQQMPGQSKSFTMSKFLSEEKSILVAQARSYGTGIDIPGDKNVIIVKLDFDVPTDPLFKAQSNYIEKEGGNAFADLSVPRVAIRTKQQIGRAIRSSTDRAFIVICDGRLARSNWGKKVLRSLPFESYFKEV